MFGGVGEMKESNDLLYFVRESMFFASFIVVKLVGGKADVYTGSSDLNVERDEEEEEDEEEEARRLFCVSTDPKALSLSTLLSNFFTFPFNIDLLCVSYIGVLRSHSKDVGLPIVIKLGRIVSFIVPS
jgi:hypothetical protein